TASFGKRPRVTGTAFRHRHGLTASDRLPDSVAGRNDARRLHHDDHCALGCTRLMFDPLWHRVPLLRSQPHSLAALELKHELPLENEEELVLLVVLVPMEVALDHA